MLHAPALAHVLADAVLVDEPAIIRRATPEPREPGPRPEPPIDEVHTVQVRLDDGRWHREMSQSMTACGLAIRNATGRRPKKYEGHLCEGGPHGPCWSTLELVIAEAQRELDAEDRKTGAFDRIRLLEQTNEPSLISTRLDRDQRAHDRLNARIQEILARKKQP